MKQFKWMSAVLVAALTLGMNAVPGTVLAAETAEAPCTLAAGGQTVKECDVTEGGYTYKDYNGGETKVDLFTYAIPEGTETVDLTFEEKQLIYNYDVDGETYLAGWVEDPTAGTTAITCAVDSDQNGVYDVLQIQMPYTVDDAGNWGGGELIYAVTFQEVKNTTDKTYSIYAGGKELSNPKVTKGGYIYKDYYAGDVPVDLYTYELSQGTESVDLKFPYKRLVYNYDPDGATYLAGWVDDPTLGTKAITCKVDYDKNGTPDVIQVQNTYNTDADGNWSGGGILYAITFKYAEPCEAPANVKVAVTSKGLKLNWNKVKGAEKYAVYRKTGSGAYTQIKKTTSVSYTDESVANGSKYTYYVKAVDKTGKSSKASAKVSTYYLKGLTLKELSSKNAGKMTVKWSKNTKATGYKICYSTKSDFSGSKTVTVKDASSVTKTISSLTKGKKYYVKVRAYKKVNDKAYYSVWTAKKSVTIKK